MTTALLLLLTGCSLFSRSQSRFYSLDPIVPAGAVAARPGRPAGIDTLELPPGFDRREIIVRKANQQLEIRATEQWSAQLQTLVLHTLASDLADRLPAGVVLLPGAAKPLAPSRSIEVSFEDFSAGPESRFVLDARWTIRDTSGAGSPHHDRIAIDLASLDSASIASGASRALAELADRIAAAM